MVITAESNIKDGYNAKFEIKCKWTSEDVIIKKIIKITQSPINCDNAISIKDLKEKVYPFVEYGDGNYLSFDDFFTDNKIPGCTFNCIIGKTCGLD